MSSLVATTGCFDCFHAGHLWFLERCTEISFSGRVVVLMDSDKRVRSMKGSSRPIFPEEVRRKFLYQSGLVSQVIIFDDDDSLANWLKVLAPDVLCKGIEWKGKKIVGEEYIGQLSFIGHDIELSTSLIESAIKNKIKEVVNG
jgi:D-beta-D-heptose 7-phosphate kinase/D-beta-D-heptose 1-phosphate adenosyltransferase